MKYVDKVLGRDEAIVHETRLHWIIFVLPLFLIMLGMVALRAMLADEGPAAKQAGLVAALFFTIGILTLLKSFIAFVTTEIAVTSRRVVFKRGLIARDTIEISLDRVEGLDVKQSILGRILNFGTVLIRGTGLGLQPMHRVAGPLHLRNAAFGEFPAQRTKVSRPTR